MPRTARILVVDDEPDMREVCRDTLERLPGVEVVEEGDPLRACELLQEEQFDLLLSDIRMPGMDGVELLRRARQADPDLPVLIFTGYPTVETAIKCLKLGAVDYLTKPFLPDDLMANARRFLEERRLRDENRLLARQVERAHRFEELVGDSPAMRTIYDTIDRIAGTDVDVLIQGETGTGKELVARALHKRSKRKQKRFVPVDCGAIPDNLLESEFFGHERGAFTGAEKRSLGLLEYADQGTVFLDELGELPLLLQAKLLRALQERKVRRVGGRAEIPFDVRIVAATARDLPAAVKDGSFREDLLYRINVVQVALPPLRDRRDDIRLLARHFLAKHAPEMGKDVGGISEEALEVLEHYAWPGNVRELQNAVRRGIAMTRTDRIEVDDLPDRMVVSAGSTPGEPTPGAKAAGGQNAEGLGFFDLRARRVAQFEREFLSDLLRQHDGDVTAAAQAAGMPRGTCYRLLKNLQIKPADFRRDV